MIGDIKLCKSGCTRLVLLVGKYAIKIPRFDYGWKLGLCGLLANMQEKEFSPISEKACSVILSIPGGFLNVMPRCDPITDSQWSDIKSACPLSWLPLPVELKRDSFGVYKNRVVVVDYGS